ncbi:MAG: hypothetical protein J6N76_09130, partial [Lachnospiraceae bacterium]|nr:hypothetical protein [Lachnospiraceae bacterium]
MAIGLNLSADTIRTATPSPSANNPAAANTQEASREKKEPSQLEKAKEREQAAPEERDIISVSEDGDTVAVRRDQEAEEEAAGSVTALESEDEQSAVTAIENGEREAEEIEAPELEPIEAPEIEPMELPQAAKEAIEK